MLNSSASSSTGPVQRWDAANLDRLTGVASRRELAAAGVGDKAIAANLAARRWQRSGAAIVLHNGRPSREQRELVMLINCGPRSVMTSFTAMARWGLRGWERNEVHVLAPMGTRNPARAGLVLHRASNWAGAELVPSRRLHRIGPALLLAAGSFSAVRPACAVLAAGVQQRLVTAETLHAALAAQPKVRHRRALLLALYDIEQGAHALSEIDFVRLCRRNLLPPPMQQTVRVEPSGRRRYLDALWKRRDGSILAVEVDGAIHMDVDRWVGDQLRQNEVAIAGATVLRFPSVLVRDEDPIVAGQLRRGLRL